MALLDHLKTHRRRQKDKQPLPLAPFAVVAAIVQVFQLTALPGVEVAGPAGALPPGRLALFPLLSAAQWRLTREILAHYDNPYLIYARNPADFHRSRELSRRRPDLDPATLQQHSLAALLAGAPGPAPAGRSAD